MKKNLIISAACGFGIQQLELFIRSLRKYYDEDICFIIGENDYEIEKELKKYGCICIKKNVDKRDIQIKRYAYFLDFIISKNYKRILFCDSRDIYFQANPFSYEYKGSINFFLEDKKIADCPINSEWMIGTYGRDVYEKLSNKIISCGGTILGDQKSIEKFLRLMIQETNTYKFKKRLKYLLTFRRDPQARGSDQSHGNFIAHNKLIKNSFFYSNESGPVATIYHLKKINFNKKLQLLNSNSQLYTIVHQYDKKWDIMKESVNSLKKELNIKFDGAPGRI